MVSDSMITLSLLLCGSSVRFLSSRGAWWAPWGQEVSSVDCCIPRAWSSAWHPMRALVIVTKWMHWTMSWSRTSAFSEIVCMFVCMSQCHFYNFFLALSTLGTHLEQRFEDGNPCALLTVDEHMDLCSHVLIFNLCRLHRFTFVRTWLMWSQATTSCAVQTTASPALH